MSDPSNIAYSPLEAAYYARLHPSTVRVWLNGRLQATKTDGQVNFLEFVQLLAVRELRNKGITLRTICDTIAYVRKHCAIEYPFATKDHQTFIDGKQLFIRVKGEAQSFSASGKYAGQFNIEPLVELYMTKLEFDSDGLAHKFVAYDYENEKITLSPDEHYGQPILASNGHNPFVLAQAVQAEGGFDKAAAVYGLPRTAMIAAVDYVDSLDLKPKQEQAA
ncbi:MAG: hypothetical protein ACPG4A_09600 [Pseudomonadales bacterium]